jgi:hypothetical protein
MNRLHDLRSMKNLDPRITDTTPLLMTLEKIMERIQAIRALETAKNQLASPGLAGKQDLDLSQMVDDRADKNSRRTRTLRPPPRWGINE